MIRSRPLRALVAVAALVALAGCSGAAPPAAPSVAPDGVREIALKALDAFRFEPASFAVKAGEKVRFVVTNRGAIPHEFFVGDAAAQDMHEREMAGSGMVHDDPMGIGLEPGQTKTLEVTFSQPGQMLAGCHVPVHYGAGMKATIDVTP